MKFTGTKDYVATDDLKVAVNASIVLERPLLIKGEPGTGKTMLAEEVSKALGAPLLRNVAAETARLHERAIVEANVRCHEQVAQRAILAAHLHRLVAQRLARAQAAQHVGADVGIGVEPTDRLADVFVEVARPKRSVDRSILRSC